MINPNDAKINLHVFYQQPHMQSPEYGVITQIGFISIFMPQTTLIHVRFFGEITAKACRAVDLHWPPNYCSQDQYNPKGQLFS